MSKLKYDVSGATPGGGDWEHVKPGLYILRLQEWNVKESKAGNPMWEIVFKPVAEADGTKVKDGAQIWYYILTDGTQDGRVRMFTDALGLPPKGTIDPEEQVGEHVQGLLKSDKDQDDQYRPRLSKLMPIPEGVELGADESEAEEDDDDEAVDLAALTRTQLKALIKEHELDIRVLKSASDDDLRAQIAEALGTGVDEEEEEDEAEEDEDEQEIDLSTLDRAALKKLIKENELEIRILKSMSDDDIRAAIAEALGGEASSEEEEDEEEEDEDASNGYDQMSIQDLKNALKERGLSTSGAKKALVARLSEDDAKSGDPF